MAALRTRVGRLGALLPHSYTNNLREFVAWSDTTNRRRAIIFPDRDEEPTSLAADGSVHEFDCLWMAELVLDNH